jgi:hypothetical protein
LKVKELLKFLMEDRKNAGGKYEGKSGDVVENKCRKNVRKGVSRDVHENKLVKIALWRC